MAVRLTEIERQYFVAQLSTTNPNTPFNHVRREHMMALVGSSVGPSVPFHQLEKRWLQQVINDNGGTISNFNSLENLWRDVVLAIGQVPSNYLNDNKITFYLNVSGLFSFLQNLVNDNGGVYFPFQENASEGAELLVDGDMEAVGVADWTAGNAATLSKQTGTRTGGSGTKVLRVARSITNNLFAAQVILTVGKRYRIQGWTRSDGNATPRIDISTVVFTGTTSTDWQPFDVEGIATVTSLVLRNLNSTGKEYVEWDDVTVNELTNDPGDVSLAVNPALALGRDILLEGTFPNNPGVWTVGGSWTIAGGKALFDDTSIGRILYQSIPIQGGATYTLTFDISELSSTNVGISFNGTGGTPTWVATESYTAGSYTRTFTASETDVANSSFSIFGQTSGAGTGKISNITLKQTDILASTDFPGSELVVNGDFSDGINNWVDQGGSPSTTEIVSGRMHVVCGGASVGIKNDPAINVGAGTRVRYKFDYEVISGTMNAINNSVSNYSETFTGTGSVAVEYTAGTSNNIPIFRQAGATNCEFFVDNVSITLANPLNGDITGAFIDQNAGAKLKKSYLFDGTNDFVNIHSAEINSIFDPTKGTILGFTKVSSAGVWTDGTDRYIFQLNVDGDNQIWILKHNSNNLLRFRYEAGGTIETVDKGSFSPTDYFMWALTWDTGVANEIEAFVNGVSVGTSSTLGTWVGNLSSIRTIIGALNTTPNNVTDGFETHIMLNPEVLDATEILKISNLAGTT